MYADFLIWCAFPGELFWWAFPGELFLVSFSWWAFPGELFLVSFSWWAFPGELFLVSFSWWNKIFEKYSKIKKPKKAQQKHKKFQKWPKPKKLIEIYLQKIINSTHDLNSAFSHELTITLCWIFPSFFHHKIVIQLIFII